MQQSERENVIIKERADSEREERKKRRKVSFVVQEEERGDAEQEIRSKWDSFDFYQYTLLCEVHTL
jgi:hypothetical protein